MKFRIAFFMTFPLIMALVLLSSIAQPALAAQQSQTPIGDVDYFERSDSVSGIIAILVILWILVRLCKVLYDDMLVRKYSREFNMIPSEYRAVEEALHKTPGQARNEIDRAKRAGRMKEFLEHCQKIARGK